MDESDEAVDDSRVLFGADLGRAGLDHSDVKTLYIA